MKKRYILLVPVGGLANRMKAIDSAIKLSRKTNSELHIIWFKDRGLNCRFDQLFEPIDLPNVKVTEATWSDYLLYDRPRQKNIFIPRLFQKATFDNCIYEKQALHLFYENFDFYDWAKNRKVYIASFVYFYSPEDENDRFSVFRPLASILQEIDTRCSLFGTNTVGVHILRTDNALSIAQSPTRLFIERLKKEQERLAKEIARCQGMLSNPNFVNKAPEAKVNAEKEKLQKYEEMMEKVKTQLTQMDK